MFAIVIDDQGYKVEFVVLNEDKTVQFYTLKENENIIEKDWQIANSMNKPKWNFETEIWEETEPKDDEQVDICPTPTHDERLTSQEEYSLDLDFRLCMLEMAL